MSTERSLHQLDAKTYAILFLLLSVAALLFYIATLPPIPCAGCNAKVGFVFSPDSEGQVITLMRTAQKTIDIEVYTFTSEDIIRELGEAEKRGVAVRIIVEPRTEDTRKDKVVDLLLALGVDVRWASLQYKLTHSKFIVIDGGKALVGSINLSDSALNKNREAAVVVEGKTVKELADIFEKDWAMATPA